MFSSSRRILIVVFLPLLMCVPAAAQRQLNIYRPILGASGSSVADVGDVDRDGVSDFAIGTPNAVSFAGHVSVYSGRTRRIIHTIGGVAEDRFGTSVAGIGDIDGDGFDDWIAGAPGDIVGGGPGTAHVVSGRQGAIRRHTGPSGSSFGFCVAGVGDVDRDGRPDYAIGAPALLNRQGIPFVSVYSGRTGARIHIAAGVQQMGVTIVGLGDLDRDGHADYAVGGNGGNGTGDGQVTIFSGRFGSVLRRMEAPSGVRNFGISVGNAGDVDGDGLADLLVGAQTAAGFGTVTLYSAFGSRIHQITATQGLSFFGAAATGVGDLDLDRVPDFAVGAPSDDDPSVPGLGAVYFYSGRTGLLLSRYRNPSTNTRLLGSSIASIRDADGDGIREILVGAPGRNETHELTYDFPGRVTSFGTGCRGSAGVPALSLQGTLAIGRTVTVSVDNLRASIGGLLIAGVSNRTWANIPLPFGLTPIGAPGCWLYVSLDAALPLPSNSSGVARIDAPIPDSRGLVGGRLFLQYLSFDAAANAAGLAASNGADVLIGY